MTKRLVAISGRVKARDVSRLDSNRYEYIDLAQTEPNPGNPDSDGALYTSLVDGTRSWTTIPLLSGARFKQNSLDSATSNYVLGLIGDPFTGETLIGITTQTGGLDSEFDTLQTVTDRGAVTTNIIDVAGLILGANTDSNSTQVLFRDSTGLAVTRELSTLFEDTLQTVTDRGAVTTNIIDVAGLILGANTDSASTAVLLRDSAGLVVTRELSTLFEESDTLATVTGRGSTTAEAISIGGLTINNLNSTTELNVLTVDSVGTVGFRLIDSEQDTLQTVTQRGDSTNVAVTLAGITVPNLTLNTSGGADWLVVYDSATRQFQYKVSQVDSEGDTLDTVTTRGNVTTNPITVGQLSSDSATVTGDVKFTERLRDNNNLALIIYDSTGSVLWGA